MKCKSMNYKDLPYIRLNGGKILDDEPRASPGFFKKKKRKGGLHKQGSVSCEVLNMVEEATNPSTSTDIPAPSMVPLRPAPAVPGTTVDDCVAFRPGARNSHVRSVDAEGTSSTRVLSGDWKNSFRNLRDQQRAGVPSEVYEVIHDFTGHIMDELSLKRGTTVKVITKQTGEEGWYYGQCGNIMGFFPAANVKLIGNEPHRISAREITPLYDGSDLPIIGQGGFSVVYKVCYQNEEVAFKKLKNNSADADSEKYMQALKHEAVMINRFKHKNIVRLYGICEEKPYVGLILELCAGKSLKDQLRGFGDSFISVRTMVDWGLQIACAMNYLSQNSCIHRDLKADNVLVKEEVCVCFLNLNSHPSQHAPCEVDIRGLCRSCRKTSLDRLTLKLTDFGVMKQIMPEDNRMSKTVGTNAFLAPEAYIKHQYSESSDVWSFGVLLWEILTKKEPYGGVAGYLVAFQVGNKGSTLEVDEDCPLLWKDIMKSCWEIEPQKRPTFSELCKSFEDYAQQLKADNVTEEEEQRVHEAQQKLYSYVNNPDNRLNESQEDVYTKLCQAMATIMDRKGQNGKSNDQHDKKPRPPQRKRITKGDIGRPDNDFRHVFSVQNNLSHSSFEHPEGQFVILTNGDTPVSSDFVPGTLPRNGGIVDSVAGTLPRRDKLGHAPLHNALSISSPNLNQIKLEEEAPHADTHGTLRRKDAIKRKKVSIGSPTVPPPTVPIEGESVVELADAEDLPPVDSSPDSARRKKKGEHKHIKFPNILKVGRQKSRDDGRLRSPSTPSSARSSTSSTSSNLHRFGHMTRTPMPLFHDTRARSATTSRLSEDDAASLSPSIQRNKVAPARVNKPRVQPTSHTNTYVRGSNSTSSDLTRPVSSNHRTISIDDTIPSPSESGHSDLGYHVLGHRRTDSDDRAGMNHYERLRGNTLSPPIQQAPRHSPIEPSLSTVVPAPCDSPVSDVSSVSDDPYVECGPIPPGVERDRDRVYNNLPYIQMQNKANSGFNHSTTMNNHYVQTNTVRRPETLPLHNPVTPESGFGTCSSSLSLADQVPLIQAPPPPPRPPVVPPRDGSIGL